MKYVKSILLLALFLACSEKKPKTVNNAEIEAKIETEQKVEVVATQEKNKKKDNFISFIALFEDNAKYLGDMEVFSFPVPYEELKLENAIAKEYLHFLNLSSSKLDFCRNHLNENHSFYPIMRFSQPESEAVVVYYAVPEMPKNRVEGSYYFMFTYDKTGNGVDVFPIAFNGTEYKSDFSRRYSLMQDFNGIETITTSSKSRTEFASSIMLGKEGKIEESIGRIHFGDLFNTWIILSNDSENGSPDGYYVEKYCDARVEEIELIVTDDLKLKFLHSLGQEGIGYNVERFYTDYDQPEVYRFELSSQYDGVRHVKMMYDSPEKNVAIFKGLHNSDTAGGEQGIFATEEFAYSGSIKIIDPDCEGFEP